MKGNYIIVTTVVVLVVFIVGISFLGKPATAPTENLQNIATSTSELNLSSTTKPVSGSSSVSKNSSRVVFSVSDDSVISENVQSIIFTINEISAFNTRTGWVTVSNVPKTFDLLSLHNSARNEIFADSNLPVGTYSQIRFTLGKVSVVPKGGLKSVEAKLLTQVLKLDTKILVEKAKISAVSLDFNSASALHNTIDGNFAFFPVVRLTTQHGIKTVQILAKNVELFNGTTDFDQTWGVDENGTLKINFSIPSTTKIEFLGKVIHLIPVDENPMNIKINAQGAVDIALKNSYITSAISVKTITQNGKQVWQVTGTKGTSAFVYVILDTITGSVVEIK